MPEETGIVKIRVKSGESEAEIETSMSNMRQAIELIPEVLGKLPQSTVARRSTPVALAEAPVAQQYSHPGEPTEASPPPGPISIPTVTIDKGDSLSDVISKFFADTWGRSPRKLVDVREALQSYGLNYPKQSVAVALLRLAKGSKIRRFKAEGGEYVYTATTGAIRGPTPAPTFSSPAPPSAEVEPVQPEGEAQTEEQLNLDVPSAN